MRRSVNDPDGFEWLVLCNDKLLDYCVEADDEEGWAKCLVVNRNGEIACDFYDGKPFVGIIRGKIEFKHI